MGEGFHPFCFSGGRLAGESATPGVRPVQGEAPGSSVTLGFQSPREREREGKFDRERQRQNERAANDLWTLGTDSDIPNRSRTRAFVHSLIYSTVSTRTSLPQQLLLQWCMA